MVAKSKPSALELAFSKKSFKGIDWYLIFPVGVGLAIVSALIFGYQLFVVIKDKSITHDLSIQAEGIAQKTERRIGKIARDLAIAANDQTVRGIFLRPNARDIKGQEEALQIVFPEAIRIRLVTPNISLLLPEEYPGYSYACIDILKKATALNAVPKAELHVFGRAGEHIDFAQRVDHPTTKQLIGVLLLSYPTETAVELFNETRNRPGYIELRQGKSGWEDLVVSKRGLSRNGGDVPQHVRDIEGSALTVAYSSFHGFAPLENRNLLSLSAGFISSLFLALGIAWMRLNIDKFVRLSKHSDEAETPLPATSHKTQLAQPVSSKHLASAKQPPSLPKTKKSQVPSTPKPKKPVVEASIFRAYDIRGIVGKDLSEPVAKLIGKSIGSELIARGFSEIVVARDGRLSGPDMLHGLMAGLQSVGCDVVDIGAVPTPVLYFAANQLDSQSGVMVTGSHNPSDYNGFKIVLGGDTLSGEDIKGLYQRILDKNFNKGSGGAQSIDVLDDYIQEVAGDVQLEQPLKVVIDCGNGIPGAVAPQLLDAIGAEVVELYCEVDGEFPNHHPDPSKPENLQDLIVAVKSTGADIGVAFDGDGDRLGVVTKDGDIIYSDRILMLFAMDVLSRNPGATILYDVKCTAHLSRVVLGHGGTPLMWKTGHSFIKRKMKEVGAQLAGEMSGHFFFKERWFGFDDGMYAACRLLEILASDFRPAEEVLAELPNSVCTPELNIEMNEGDNFKFIKEFNEKARFEGARLTKIDGIRADYDDGWGLVRASNTTPALVLRFDGDSQEALDRIQAAFKAQILKIRPNLPLPF